MTGLLSGPPACTVVIPTFNRADKVGRAIDTALAQDTPCDVIVVDHGSTDDTPARVRAYGDRLLYLRRPVDSGPILAWLDGVAAARTPFVHLTYDDDWLDPAFLRRCLPLMTPDCAFVFTDVTLHQADGGERPLFAELFATGTHEAAHAERVLIERPLTISPGCALFRRDDVLDALYLGRVPGGRARLKGVGPDLAMFLLPLLRYPRFGFVAEPLAHFEAHEASITIAALEDEARRAALEEAYREVKRYYLTRKLVDGLNLNALLYDNRVLAARFLAQATAPDRGGGQDR